VVPKVKTSAHKADLYFIFVLRQGRVSFTRDKLFARDCSSFFMKNKLVGVTSELTFLIRRRRQKMHLD
jgi:hypothetical protein